MLRNSKYCSKIISIARKFTIIAQKFENIAHKFEISLKNSHDFQCWGQSNAHATRKQSFY